MPRKKKASKETTSAKSSEFLGTYVTMEQKLKEEEQQVEEERLAGEAEESSSEEQRLKEKTLKGEDAAEEQQLKEVDHKAEDELTPETEIVAAEQESPKGEECKADHVAVELRLRKDDYEQKVEGERLVEEQRLKEEQLLSEDVPAELQRLSGLNEEQMKAEETSAEEQKLKEEEQTATEKRLAAEGAASEEERLMEERLKCEALAVEEQRRKDEQTAEEERLAAEATSVEQERLSDEQLNAEAAAAKELKLKEEQTAEEDRLAAEAARAEQERLREEQLNAEAAAVQEEKLKLQERRAEETCLATEAESAVAEHQRLKDDRMKVEKPAAEERMLKEEEQHNAEVVHLAAEAAPAEEKRLHEKQLIVEEITVEEQRLKEEQTGNEASKTDAATTEHVSRAYVGCPRLPGTDSVAEERNPASASERRESTGQAKKVTLGSAELIQEENDDDMCTQARKAEAGKLIDMGFKIGESHRAMAQTSDLTEAVGVLLENDEPPPGHAIWKAITSWFVDPPVNYSAGKYTIVEDSVGISSTAELGEVLAHLKQGQVVHIMNVKRIVEKGRWEVEHVRGKLEEGKWISLERGDVRFAKKVPLVDQVMELGFSEQEALEACKRCSTAEGAVEYLTNRTKS